MGAVAQKVSDLEKAMMELVYQSRLTEMNINRLSEEMREFKNNTEMDIKKVPGYPYLCRLEYGKEYDKPAYQKSYLCPDCKGRYFGDC